MPDDQQRLDVGLKVEIEFCHLTMGCKDFYNLLKSPRIICVEFKIFRCVENTEIEDSCE